MLFNSFEFIVWFLPITLLGFFAIGGSGRFRLAVFWLILASLFFYAWWKPAYLILLIASVLINYTVGRRLARAPSRILLALGISLNLGALIYFKYTGFLLFNFTQFSGIELTWPAVILPLGISFFTFQQIAYLVDAHDGVSHEDSFANYCLFVTFFPQLVAGPIVHHKDVLPQFAKEDTFRPQLGNFTVGITVFAVGLFKKAVLADAYLAPPANTIFNAAQAGAEIGLVDAWAGALLFTLQIYFDFSGYSDMAIGIARMFGVRLPINFNSPYKATSIISFWERWHITLTRFLTAYVYNPLVLRATRRRMAKGRPLLKRSKPRLGPFVGLLALPTLITMFLAGVWHGAGYQFLLFGLLHGAYLVINHAWRALLQARQSSWLKAPPMLYRLTCLLLTFTCVTVAMMVFRTQGLEHLATMGGGLLGLGGMGLPDAFARFLPLVPLPLPGDWLGGSLLALRDLALIPVLLAWVWLLPNTQQWLAEWQIGLAPSEAPERRWLRWRPSLANGAVVGTLVLFAALNLLRGAPAEFIYFDF